MNNQSVSSTGIWQTNTTNGHNISNAGGVRLHGVRKANACPFKIHAFLSSRGWYPTNSLEGEYRKTNDPHQYNDVYWSDALAIECMEAFILMEQE